MADIRINALATTAASTASDDFIAVDGSANGTRKLNAYSPTFGGNLTVSGTGTSSFGGLVKATGNSTTSFGVEIANGAGFSGTAQYYLTAGTGAGFTAFRLLRGNGAAGYEDNGFNADSFSGARFNLNALGGSGGNFTISGGNLTVSGTGTQTLNGKLDVITAASSAANVDIAVLRQNYAGTAGHEGLISFTNISGTSVGKIGTRAVDGSNTSLVLRNFVSGSLADALTLSPSVATLAGNLTVSGTGTSSFSGPLTVSPGAIGGGYLNLNKDGADLYLETQRWTGVGSNFGATRITGSTSGGGFLTFSTSNETTIGAQTFTERMRLTSVGNLGIGTTSPASRLHAKTVGTAGQNTDVLTLDNIPTAVSNGNGTGVLFRSTLNDGAGTNAVNAARIYSFLTNGTPSAEYFSLALQTMNAGTLTTAATLTGSGNLILKSDGQDSSNGKLQLAESTANSGGIGFGPDVSLYRESSVKLTANSTGSSLTLALAVGGTQKAIIASDGTTAYLGATAAGGSTILYSGNAATALTLDSSQNATFAGYLSYNNVGADTKAIFNRTSGNAFSFEHETSRFTLYNRGTSGYAWLATNTGSFVVGNTADLATNATDGFLYVPKCAGTPTGTPTAIAGKVPIVVDYTNHKLYFYSGGAWRDAGP